MYRFELFRDSSRQYRFRLVAANGEIVATSEAYTRKAKAKQTVFALTDAIAINGFDFVDLTKMKV